jgi:hypothetical protein
MSTHKILSLVSPTFHNNFSVVSYPCFFVFSSSIYLILPRNIDVCLPSDGARTSTTDVKAIVMSWTMIYGVFLLTIFCVVASPQSQCTSATVLACGCLNRGFTLLSLSKSHNHLCSAFLCLRSSTELTMMFFGFREIFIFMSWICLILPK